MTDAGTLDQIGFGELGVVVVRVGLGGSRAWAPDDQPANTAAGVPNQFGAEKSPSVDQPSPAASTSPEAANASAVGFAPAIGWSCRR